MKEIIFVGPQVEQVFKVHDFRTQLNATERRACYAF